ncbi:MAG: hypothetical protein KDK72_07800 [Chlamydiia bacterium]|nr:hypothetical protein [Chlamydiia bacterium]
MTQTLRRYFILMLTLFLSISSAGYAIIRSNMLHKEQLKSGMQFDEKITLFNNQSVPVEIEIKQADYRCNAAGENFFSQPGTEPLSNAEWIKLPCNSIT